MVCRFSLCIVFVVVVFSSMMFVCFDVSNCEICGFSPPRLRASGFLLSFVTTRRILLSVVLIVDRVFIRSLAMRFLHLWTVVVEYCSFAVALCRHYF